MYEVAGIGPSHLLAPTDCPLTLPRFGLLVVPEGTEAQRVTNVGCLELFEVSAALGDDCILSVLAGKINPGMTQMDIADTSGPISDC